ncbi:MAG TPA: amidohydrolase family protein, partial [Chitinophagaceae bacterium]|nr:amidohydrolase family protein [Chitinophagaceae bacterium]
MRIILYILILLSAVNISCTSKKEADLVVYNAHIYTVDSAFSTAEAMAVKDGKIMAIGTKDDILGKYQGKEELNGDGQFIYPGFIDAHAHFVGYALGLATVSLVGTESWDNIVDHLAGDIKDLAPGQWLIGRGWDQNDWAIKEFPNNEKLNQAFPDRPVLLTRVDGHAAIANQKAL